MGDHRTKVFNARSVYLTSLCTDSSPSTNRGPRSNTNALEYDLLDSILHYHLLKHTELAAFRSTNYTKPVKNWSENINKQLLLLEAQKKEYDKFCESLDKKDDWEIKMAEYLDKYEKIQAKKNSSHDLSNKSTDKKLSSIGRKNIKSDILQETSRSLLMGADVDFLQDDEAPETLFKDNFNND